MMVILIIAPLLLFVKYTLEIIFYYKEINGEVYFGKGHVWAIIAHQLMDGVQDCTYFLFGFTVMNIEI